MAKYYAPNFSGLLPLFDGKSAAGGKLYAYRAGSSIPAPLFDEDGVELGSWVSIDSNGCADFLLDSSLSYKLVAKDALGAVVGEWDNVKATNAPGGMDNPMTAPGDIIVGGTGGTATALPVGTDDQMLSPYTVGGVKKLKWKNVPAQTGDHKVMIDGADGAPGYLLDKLADGDNAHFSKSGNAVKLDTDNDKVAADNTDDAPGYLLDKLYAGDGVSIEAVTDGDVRKVKISVTGGGGGGGDQVWQSTWPWSNAGFTTRRPYSVNVPGVSLPSTIKSFTVFPNFNPYSLIVNKFVLWVAIYDLSVSGSPLISSFTWSDAKHPSTDWSNTFATFNFDAPISIDRSHNYRAVFYWYDNYAANRNWLGCYQQGGNSYICGFLDLYYSATGLPPSTYNNSGWTAQSRIPWFQLNSFSV